MAEGLAEPDSSIGASDSLEITAPPEATSPPTSDALKTKANDQPDATRRASTAHRDQPRQAQAFWTGRLIQRPLCRGSEKAHDSLDIPAGRVKVEPLLRRRDLYFSGPFFTSGNRASFCRDERGAR
jgi:hypothetical protein